MIRSLLLVAACCVAATACGSSELPIEPTFDGNWVVTSLEVGDQSIDLDRQPIQIEIDTGQAALRGRSTCLRFFGSYSLIDDGADDGEATFTIPSPAADDTCDAESADAHTAVVAALEAVTRWQRQDARLLLTGPDSNLELTPAG